jgi:hypothetical protein
VWHEQIFKKDIQKIHCVQIENEIREARMKKKKKEFYFMCLSCFVQCEPVSEIPPVLYVFPSPSV